MEEIEDLKAQVAALSELLTLLAAATWATEPERDKAIELLASNLEKLAPETAAQYGADPGKIRAEGAFLAAQISKLIFMMRQKLQ